LQLQSKGLWPSSGKRRSDGRDDEIMEVKGPGAPKQFLDPACLCMNVLLPNEKPKHIAVYANIAQSITIN